MQETDYINWWEATNEIGLDEIRPTFINLFSRAEFLPSIYHPILYKYLKNSQIKHWDKELFSFSYGKIQELENIIGKENMSLTLLSNFQLLSNAYQNLLDIEERIVLMNRFKGSEELKAKIFSINIYNDLLNGVFGELLKLFIAFESTKDNKDLSQKTLTPQIDFLASPKRGYQKITDLADSNIRNAISHGGVKAVGSKMIFSYRKGKEHLQHESTVYEFKDSLLRLFDGVSGIILSWFGYLCDENISYNEVYGNELINEETSLFFEKLSMSTLLTTCDKVYQIDINNEAGKRQHVNVEFIGTDLDINSRMFLGIYTAERVFQLRKLAIEDTIMIAFKSPKIVNSFFTINCSVINDLSRGKTTTEKVSQIIWESGNILMFPINDEDRNEFEDSFRHYSDIENDDFYITEIEDISSEDKKRFKAVAYLKRAKRPKHVKSVVGEIIEQIKILENYGFSSNKVKYGKMDADLIYLTVYKKEVRRGKDRALQPNNDNFIAQVQYDKKMEFPIRNGFVDPYLKLRREKMIEYNWNPNF
ncbi:hypothetical protein MX629_01055 [Carnobacterium divergens]|uniref:Apea-like HEPN domain-containing protein n=1 Tax=Carnobacterium divergens TaxID=2748 RepID=A0AAW8R5G6_CARDV|nr:hypothetical protein [Carnobacterium divergens]MDT1957009.1 hypothetical protein [Carnobacterium divergens]MDT1972979.1 hypothetical protein [Carnobacterium divergens]